MIVNRDQLDAQTAQTIEIWLHENLHGVSSELLGLEDAGVTEMMMMCNPVRDHGPAAWHRDFSPYYCAPLQGYTEDIIENGPRYMQWNVPLYDDDVLWVVPGSHKRSTTPEELAQLSNDIRAALDVLHPGRGEKGKLQSTFFLSKAARRIHHLKRPDFDRFIADWSI